MNQAHVFSEKGSVDFIPELEILDVLLSLEVLNGVSLRSGEHRGRVPEPSTASMKGGFGILPAIE